MGGEEEGGEERRGIAKKIAEGEGKEAVINRCKKEKRERERDRENVHGREGRM